MVLLAASATAQAKGTANYPNQPILTMLGGPQSDSRADADPVQVSITIAGMSYFYLSNNYRLSAVLGANVAAEQACQLRLNPMCNGVLADLNAKLLRTIVAQCWSFKQLV